MLHTAQVYFTNHFTKYIKLYLVVTMIIWGVSWASSKVCVAYTDSFTLLFLKFFLSVLAMAPFVLKDVASIKFDVGFFKIFVFGVAFLIMYNIFFFMGLSLGYAAFGGVFVTTINPMITFVLVAILSKIKIPTIQKIGLFIGLLGGFIMLKIWDISPANLLHSGNIYFFLAALGWSLVSIISAKGSKTINSMTLTFVLLVGAAIVSFFFVPNGELLNVLSFDFHFWVNAFIAFILTTAFATTLYFKGVAILGASEASAYLFLVPVFAIVSSNLILGETIDLITIVGGVFAMAALYLINFQSTYNKYKF